MLRSLLLRHCLLRCSLRLRRLRRLSAAQRVSRFFFFALFFFLSNTPLSLRCSHRCPRAHACFIHAPRKFTFFVFGQFRTERDPFRGCAAHRCVYFLRRFFVFRFPCALLCTVFVFLRAAVVPCCRRAVEGTVEWKAADFYELISPMVQGVRDGNRSAVARLLSSG